MDSSHLSKSPKSHSNPQFLAQQYTNSMSSALDVPDRRNGHSPSNEYSSRVSSSFAHSTSPQAGVYSSSFGKSLSRAPTASSKQLSPFATEDIKILLLENVNKTGRDALEAQGYQVTFHKSSLPEDELIEKIRWGNAFSLSSSLN